MMVSRQEARPISYTFLTPRLSLSSHFYCHIYYISRKVLFACLFDLGSGLKESALSDLKPHYCNGLFGSVYLLALDNTKR